MRCQDVQKQLHEFAAGELPMDLRSTVQAHVTDCTACRQALVKIDPLAGVLAAVQTPPMPSGFAFRVLARARQRRAAERSEVWNLRRWWRLTSAPMHAAAAAVLVVGLGVGVAMGWRTTIPLTVQTAETAQPNALDAYQLEYLNEAPSGSLADNYLTLVTADTASR